MNQMDITDTMAAANPLLEIDTNFNTYLAERTRSYKPRASAGKADYAFDADFSLRQKFSGLAGWNKICKHLTANELPERHKAIMRGAVQASALQYPLAYETAKFCADRLQIGVPQVWVGSSDRPEACSVSAEGLTSVIFITKGAYEKCTPQELRFLIGCECGHIQHNHSLFYAAAPFFGLVIKEDCISTESARNKQLTNAMLLWMNLADVTADRAGMICLDDPSVYPDIMKSLREKNIFDIYALMDCAFDAEKTLQMSEKIHLTPARKIILDSSWTMLERRVLAGLEFRSCDALFSWRPDIVSSDIHAVNKQALEVRCEIILGADSVKGGAF